MLLGNRNRFVLTLLVCALTSHTALAKHHHKSHKPSVKTSGGTITVGPNLTTLTAGTLLATPISYEGLIISSGYEGLLANSAGTLTLSNSYLSGSTISYGGTVTVANTAVLESSG